MSLFGEGTEEYFEFATRYARGFMQMSFGSGEAMQIAIRLSNLMRYSVIIVSTLPIMCFYPFVQKYFNQGVMIGAVKG